MDFKIKAHKMIDTMKDEQIICLVNFLEAFLNSEDNPAADIMSNIAVTQKSETKKDKNQSEEVLSPSKMKVTAVYSVEDIIKILGISRSSTYSLMKTNPFPIVRIGKIIRVPKEPFEEWMNSQNHETK